MGILDSITGALSGKTPAQPQADTKTTKITPDDVAAVKRRRASPEFQAAAKAKLGPGDFAFHSPLPTGANDGAFRRTETDDAEPYVPQLREEPD